jgi:hypothetical protein
MAKKKEYRVIALDDYGLEYLFSRKFRDYEAAKHYADGIDKSRKVKILKLVDKLDL